jgi:hypothetical protein|tara:strand:- start:1001 stop:1540 length:540 start_codon:yes stop_codon:yes gene_type:complete
MLSNELCKELKLIAANFIPAVDLDDLVQDIFVQLLTMPKEKLKDIIENGNIRGYFNRMCKLSYYSKTSRYYYTYKKEYELVTFNNDVYVKALKHAEKKQTAAHLYIINNEAYIDKILNELYWYERELFKLYVLGDNNGKSYTYSTLSDITGISRMSIYTTIKGVKMYIEKRLKELNNGV